MTLTKQKKTYVALILDRSSSMQAIQEQIISGYNEQVETIKRNALDVPTRVSLVTFASEADEPTIWNRRPSHLETLNKDTYKPQGNTAMYDAVGLTVERLQKVEDAWDPDTSFFITIVSDGEENNSKKYNKHNIASMVKELQGTGRWTFAYIGANQDLTKVSADLGINIGNTYSFNATAAGTLDMNFEQSRGIDTYYSSRRAGKTQVKSLYTPDQWTGDTLEARSGTSGEPAQPNTVTTTQSQAI